MARFQETFRGKHKVKIDPKNFQTFDGVEDFMRDALDRYSDNRGITTSIQKFFDKLGKNGETFNA